MTQPLASVVIPAHDEGAVLGRCLHALTSGSLPGELDVIVVANACHDDTAAVAEAAGVRVLETPVAGKAHAIGLGDQACRAFPRLYLDADVELSTDAVRDLVGALKADGVLAAAPTPTADLTGVSWPVRRFQVVLGRLLGDRTALSGTGAYMLTEPAHQRVFPMPDIIADDAWVHRTFTADERVVVASARVSISPPRSVSALIRRRARVRLGNQQLAHYGRTAAEPPLRLGSLVGLVRAREVRPVDAGCFLAVLVAEKLVARWRTLRGTSDSWSTDRTTRTRS